MNVGGDEGITMWVVMMTARLNTLIILLPLNAPYILNHGGLIEGHPKTPQTIRASDVLNIKFSTSTFADFEFRHPPMRISQIYRQYIF